VVPLFSDHKILTQVAGHDSNVIKILPPLVLSEGRRRLVVGALEATLARAQKLPRAMVRFALKAARAKPSAPPPRRAGLAPARRFRNATATFRPPKT